MVVEGSAQAAVRARLQRMLDTLVASGALGALVQFRDEAGTWNGAAGVAEVESERPVSAEGWFRIGSVTKTFTAAVLLQLVGEGRVGLDDSVERWLPGLVPEGGRITLRQLLDHTSGLHNYTEDLNPDVIVRDRSRQRRPQEVVAEAVRREPRFEPGTSRAYCNTSYLLLGMVIEEATGSTYEAEVSGRILLPLGMRQTRVLDAEVLPEPHARCYLPVDGRLVDVTVYNPSQAWAAGGIVSTADDINRFYRGLLTGGLLRPSELRAMQTTLPTGIAGVDGGLGVARVRLPSGITVWGKDGGFFGCHAVSFHTADAVRQLTLSLTTGFDSRPLTHELLADIADVFGAEEVAAAGSAA